MKDKAIYNSSFLTVAFSPHSYSYPHFFSRHACAEISSNNNRSNYDSTIIIQIL